MGSVQSRTEQQPLSYMKLQEFQRRSPRSRICVSTLPAILMSVTNLLLSSSAIVTGYVMTAQRSEWLAYSLAANSLAMQRLEQTRAAKWDPYAYPVADELKSTNFPTLVEVLDVPI